MHPNFSHIFFAIGINYKKTDAIKRGDFAVNTAQYEALISKASKFGIKEFFIVSTCNRTEIYGLANNAQLLINLLCSETVGSKESFLQLCYIKKDVDAIKHIFDVAAGLDSQILGDYEIVGQIKSSVKYSKDRNHIGPFTERLINTVLQSSKSIKNKTKLSSGTVSVSYAAIQFIKNNITEIKHKKIALIGTGKIGISTCKNLTDYLGTSNITLINRTDETAIELANKFKLKSACYNQLLEVVAQSNIIIVATNAPLPIILKNDLVAFNKKVLIDLSIPNNIDPEAASLPNITLVNVDDLSKINDETLLTRVREIPKANLIIESHLNDFKEWIDARKYAPAIKAVKQKLLEMNSCKIFLSQYPISTATINHQKIQKVVNNTAVKMRTQYQTGCNYIEAINHYITETANTF